MMRKLTSNILKALLFLFSLGVLFFGAYVLPIMADEMAAIYPELEYAKLPILIASELLLVLLISGVGIIMYLLVKFDMGFTFTLKFIRALEVLVAMCVFASIGMMGMFQYLRSFGGPGPLLSFIMIGMIFVLWILAAVIMLIRSIVKESMTYKNDYDLTV